MKNSLVGLAGLSLVALSAVGCAEGSEGVTSDPGIDTAFLALTVMDCQSQATQCLEANANRRWWQRARNCTGDLVRCNTEAAFDTVETSVAEVDDVIDCADAGVDCFSDARRVSEALACEQSLEACTLETVADITGIELPTSGEIVEDTVEVVEETVDTAVTIVEDTVDTVVVVVEETVEVVEDVVEETVDTAVEVVEGAAEVVDTTIDNTLATAECANQSRKCLSSFGGFFTCRAEYRTCMDAI
jgi:hypothetical protein